ncbi:type II toxin-antitoxin system HicB family antitoxin [Roseomonas sp. BN140053]|uniref:type II toxin-antitoxin system HicB family antitoxin n=1 Tax=Roseomonas sp. BN140053 TaxID=3391898 RepID=UPI0039EA8E68
MALRYYPALFEAAGNGFGVIFPDLPGCVSAGGDMQDAAVQAAEALALHVEGMTADGDPLPAPSRLDDPLPAWLADATLVIAGRALVPVELPGRAVRANITMDEGLLSRLDAAAQAEGNTRSGFIAQAVREVLRRRVGEEA